MGLSIISLGMEFGLTIVSGYLFMLQYQNWKETKNQISLSLLFLLFLILCINFLELLSKFLFYFQISKIIISNWLIYEKLSLNSLLLLLFFVFFIWFTFYSVGWKEFYSFPIIFGGFLFYYLYKTGDLVPLNNSFFLIGSICVIILSLSSFKHKHGLLFTISISAIIFGLGHFIVTNELIKYLCFYIALIILYLGLSGWFDKYVFISEIRENEIENNWLASRIKKENMSKSKPIKNSKKETVSIKIICPICKKELLYNISNIKNAIINQDKEKPFTLMLPKATVCEHNLLLIINQELQITQINTF